MQPWRQKLLVTVEDTNLSSTCQVSSRVQDENFFIIQNYSVCSIEIIFLSLSPKIGMKSSERMEEVIM